MCIKYCHFYVLAETFPSLHDPGIYCYVTALLLSMCLDVGKHYLTDIHIVIEGFFIFSWDVSCSDPTEPVGEQAKYEGQNQPHCLHM